jgi:hypothetical protein
LAVSLDGEEDVFKLSPLKGSPQRRTVMPPQIIGINES